MHVHQVLPRMQRHSGNLSASAPVPASGCIWGLLACGDSRMSPVQGLPLYSADNTVFLIVQSDGNIVLCVLPSGRSVLCHPQSNHGAQSDTMRAWQEMKEGFLRTGQVVHG